MQMEMRALCNEIRYRSVCRIITLKHGRVMHHGSQSALSDLSASCTNRTFNEFISYQSEKPLLPPLDLIYHCNSAVQPGLEVKIKLMPKTYSIIYFFLYFYFFLELPYQQHLSVSSGCSTLINRLLVQNCLHLVAPSGTHCTPQKNTKLRLSGC